MNEFSEFSAVSMDELNQIDGGGFWSRVLDVVIAVGTAIIIKKVT